MKKIWIIFQTEFINIIISKSFLLTLFLVPLGALVIGFIISTASGSAGVEESNRNFFTDLIAPQHEQQMEGYFDPGDVIRLVSTQAQSRYIRYESEPEAQSAMQVGDIGAYYIVPENYLSEGTIYYIRPDFNPISGMEQSSAFQDLLTYNLTNGNADLAARLANPVNVETVTLSPIPQRDPEGIFTFIVPYIITMLFYIVILSSSSLMLSSINTEKTSRVLEILMTSLTPTQILTGKILALGLAGLVQTLFWGGLGLITLNRNLSGMNLGSEFQLPPSIILWGVIFFLLGYIMYASLMGGIGALVSNIREASQVTTVVIIPLIIPILVISSLIGEPNGPIAMVLSLFPLTSPVAMMTRLSATTVPIWQILLAVALAALTAWLILRAVAGLFRAQNLLSGQAFSIRLFILALIGKA
jgi:ABC-2 type transport system permease protein